MNHFTEKYESTIYVNACKNIFNTPNARNLFLVLFVVCFYVSVNDAIFYTYLIFNGSHTFYMNLLYH